jgi:hypothetical protein
MEIKIGKKQFAWAYVNYFFRLGTFFFVAPVVWKYLPKAHVDVWFLFTTTTACIGLLDFGFTPSISRAITSAFSGAKKIKKEGVYQGEISNTPNYVLLQALFSACKKVYAIIAGLALVGLSTAGTLYLWNMCPKLENLTFQEIVPTWVLFVFSTVLAIYFRYLDVFIAGRGAIALANKIGMASGVLGIMLNFIVLYLGYGLVGTVSVSLFLSILVRIVVVRLFFDRELKENLRKAAATPNPPSVLPLIWYNSKKSGLNSIGVFLIFHATLFIAGHYFPGDFPKLAITLKVFNFLNGISSSYFNMTYPRYVSLLINNKLESLRWEFLRAVTFSVLLLLAGAAVVLWKGDALLQFVGHGKVALPGMAVLLLYTGVYFTEAIHGKCATLITVKNIIPFVPTTLATGVVNVSLSMVFIRFTDLGIASFPLATLFAQFAYNAWRWPLWVIRDFQFSFKDVKNAFKFSWISFSNLLLRFRAVFQKF